MKRDFVELPRRAQRILDGDRSIVSAGGLRDAVPCLRVVNERLKMGRNGRDETECRKVDQCRRRDETPWRQTYPSCEPRRLKGGHMREIVRNTVQLVLTATEVPGARGREGQ